MARSFVYTWQYKINWPEGDNLRIAPFFVLPVDALGVHSNRQRPPGGDTFSLYLNLPGGVENVALLFGLFIIFILNIMTHIFLSMFLQFELFVLPLLPQLKRHGSLDEWFSQRSAKPSTAVRVRQEPQA